MSRPAEANPIFCSLSSGDYYLGIKLPKREANNSLPSTTIFKEGRSCISAPSYTFSRLQLVKVHLHLHLCLSEEHTTGYGSESIALPKNAVLKNGTRLCRSDLFSFGTACLLFNRTQFLSNLSHTQKAYSLLFTQHVKTFSSGLSNYQEESPFRKAKIASVNQKYPKVY
jgi:hypothetical protein